MHLQLSKHVLVKPMHFLNLTAVYIRLHSIMGFMDKFVDIFRDSFFEDLA